MNYPRQKTDTHTHTHTFFDIKSVAVFLYLEILEINGQFLFSESNRLSLETLLYFFTYHHIIIHPQYCNVDLFS